ncbi:MAG: hypothetical protein IJ871_04185, partial [Ruminococcus sp.]|nr:hypothetical protein [Ruminococcus sp.]
MNVNKMTQKSIEAVQAAQGLVTEYQNNAITQTHLMTALMNEESGLIPQLFEKMGEDPIAAKQYLYT